MNMKITQQNVYLLLPSKLSWMAAMLAEDKGITIVDAMKLLYSSDTYLRLEQDPLSYGILVLLLYIMIFRRSINHNLLKFSTFREEWKMCYLW